jgi:hypothetical protein
MYWRQQWSRIVTLLCTSSCPITDCYNKSNWKEQAASWYEIMSINFVSYQTVQHWHWGFMSSGLWCCSVGWVVSDIPELTCDCMTYEDGGTMILWKAGNHWPNGTVPYPRSLDSTAASLWEPQIAWWQTVLRHFFLTCMKLIPHITVHLSSPLRTNNAIK